METGKDLFDNNGHLTDEGLALWVDSIAAQKVSALPDKVIVHVEECMECKQAIVELRETTRELNLPGDDAFRIPGQSQGIIRKLFNASSPIMRLAAVAIVLLAVGATIGTFVLNRQPDPDKLFSQNFAPYDDIFTEKGADTTGNTIHELTHMGFLFYEKAQYDSAALVFTRLNEKCPSDTIRFYLANSILATNQDPAPSIMLLTELTTKETIFSEQARWYLALAFLKKHEVAKARNELAILVSTSASYKGKAQQLLDELK